MDIGTSSAGANRTMGLNIRVTESQLQSMERDEQARQTQEAERVNNQPHLLNLSNYIKTSWQAAVRAKTSNKIEDRYLDCARRRKGKYSPEKLGEIRKTGGSEIYMQLSSVKCRALEAWVRDIMLPPGDKPWSLSPTPIPNLPEGKEMEIAEQVQMEAETLIMMNGIDAVTTPKIKERLQEIKDKTLKEKKKKAKEDAARIETHIDDQLHEGNYYGALSEFITDLATFPTSFLEGPVVRRKKKLRWTEDQNGDYVPAVEEIPVREYSRISGYDVYPSPGAKNIQDGSLHVRARLRLLDLEGMMGVPGFKEDAIRAVLREHRSGGLRQWMTIDQERADIEDRPNEAEDPNPLLDCIKFWGPVPGNLLREWGMTENKVPDPDISYQVTAWLVGEWVIMARLNPHPLGLRPYYAASFESVNDNIWGKAPPELFKDCQDMCNAVARAISNNLGIASGPIVEYYKNRLAPGFDFQQLYPWMTIATEDDGMGAHNPAVQFHQPNSVAEPLLKVFDFFFRQASEQSGIPAYVYGNDDVGGAGKTASGLSMLMNAANKTLKGVVAHVDDKVITKSIKEHWNHVMLYDKDIEKIGDINVIARASQHLIIEEQLQMRRTEMLEATNNDWDREIIGNKGRAQMLRDTFDSMKMDHDEIVPDKEEMELMDKYQQLMAQAQQEAASSLGISQDELTGANPAMIDAAGNQQGNAPGQTMTRVNRRAGMNYQ